MITVVGSLNQDIVASVPHHPVPGETVLATGHFSNPGGKGANQAVAAARLGADVAMVGSVGADEAGRTLVESLRSDGVDTSCVLIDPGAASGLALITVDQAGENAIVVSPGANGMVTVGHINAAAEAISQAAVVLLQLEVPLAAVARAATLASGTIVLNPAPAQKLPAELVRAASLIVPNRSELGALSDLPEPRSLDDAAALSRRLETVVVVTLGSDGALIVEHDRTVHIGAPAVEVVDTTAAGDAFCGALAEALARGLRLEVAVRWAVHAGAVAVTRNGAQQSLPTTAEVQALLATDQTDG